MKKLTYILSFVLMVSGLVFMNSCELTDADTDLVDNTTDDDDNSSSAGTVESFNVQLSYNSNSLSSKCAFDADYLKAVALNDNQNSDLILVSQTNYPYIISSPNASYPKQLLSYNYPSFDNSGWNQTTVKNLGNVSLSNYSSAQALKNMSITSGSIENLNGKNQVTVSSGDVVAFKTCNGLIGVGQVSSLSKRSAGLTFKGYVYYPSSSN